MVFAICLTTGAASMFYTAAVGAMRPAAPAEQRLVAAEVRLTLRVLADSPDSGIPHRLEIVLAPICVSTVDRRYVVAVTNPILAHGVVGQRADVFLHRVPGGYRVVGGLRAGDQLGRRSPDIPKAAWAELDSKCQPFGDKTLLKLRATHAAPDFVT